MAISAIRIARPGSGLSPDRRPAITLAVASLGYFFVLLDVTIVNVGLAEIARGLDATRSELQWVVNAYALALAGSMIGAGHLADRLGRRNVFVWGLVLFGLASAGCALAPDPGALIAARLLQGIGAAALLPASLALVNASRPDAAERARAIGIWAGLGSFGLLAGPLLGGFLTGVLGWRAIFWFSAPLALLATAAALRWVEEPARARKPGRLDRGYFRDPALVAANAGAAAMNFGVLGSLFVLSLLLQEGDGFSPETTGILLLPLAAPLAILPLFVGRYIQRVGPRLPAAIGLAGTGAGFGLLALIGPDASYPLMLGPLLLAGLALGFATPGVVTGATATVAPARAGMASAINNTCRQVGGAVGVALLGGLAATGAFAISAAVLLVGGLVCGVLIRPSTS